MLPKYDRRHDLGLPLLSRVAAAYWAIRRGG